MNFTGLSNGITYLYNVTIKDQVNQTNSTATRNITIDNVIPSINFTAPTIASGEIVNTSSIAINLTVVENNTKNVTYYLYDDSGSLLQRASFSNTTYFYNFTGLSNGIYRYNATIEDKVNFTNQTVTRNITLDTTSPAIIFSSLTMGDGSFQNSSNIFVDLDVVENNTDNVTFYLYNSTANVLNKTSFRNATYSFNFTGLSDEIMYFYNVTIIDKVNFTNQTLTRNITLDRTSPAISFTSPTPENNRVINTSYLPIKLSITDASIQNITYYLFNNTGVLLNKTSFLSNTTEFNFTSLSEGSTYYYNATIIDRVNFSNSTTTRNVTIDLTAPHVITLVDPTPVDGSAGDDDIIMNWTASDNMDVNISCFPVVDSAEQDQVGTLNGTYSSAALILTGGIHTLSVRCYDNANNSNRSAERTYIVGKMNITYPENNAIVRVNGSLTINTTILFGEEFINNITLFIDEGNETRNISTSNDSLTNYTGTYSVPNKSPRYLSVTAIGFNNSRGIGLNVSVNITLVLLRISNTTSSPANTYFCSNESYSLNGSSITLSVIHNLDTLLLETNMTVVLPNSSVKAVSHLANVTDINGSSDYLQKFNFTYTPESIGNYIFRSTVKDFENQTLQSNVTVHADNSRTVNWSGVQVSNMSLKDLCTNEAILSGHPLAGTIPNNSIYNLEATMSIQPEIINFTNANITGLTLGNIINLTRRTNETDPPSGQRRIFMFDVTTNMTFDNFTWLYNYSDIQYTLTTEENMNVYKCDDLSSCVFEKQTVTIDSSDNQVILEGSSLSRFIITEPALFGNSSSFDPPIIRLLNTTKTYLNPNETFDIAATFDAFFLIDTVTMTVNSTLLSAYNTTALNSTFHIYRYNHSLSNTGDYLIQVVVLDENTFSDTASLVVYIVDNTTVNLTSNGGNMINLFDIRNGNKLYNGTTIVQPVPEGRYNLSVVTNNSEIFLYNVSVNSSLHEVLFYQNLDGAISPPTNRKSRAQLEINTTLDYDTVTIVYNYTNITGSITDEDNLELYKCESAGNCTLTQLNITIDTNQNLVTTTINNLSVFILAESIATETTTTTVTVSAGGGGGGGSSKTVQKNVALEFIPTTALQLKINQSVTAKIMAINSGEVNFDKVDVSITSPTGNVNVFPIQKEITSLGPNETTSFDVFIDAITDPGIYEVVLTGASILPFYTETAKFSIEVLQDERIVNQTKIIERITFAKDLFKENPECIEFQEVIEQAGKALEQGELMKGSSLVESAINACKETITALNDVVPSRIIPEKFNILKIILVIMILTLVIWLSMEGLIRHKRRKKILQSLNISEGNAFDENGDLESNRQYSAGYKLEGSETNNTIGSDDKTLENKPQIEEKDIWEKPKE